MDEKSDVLLVTFGDVLGTVAWLFLLCLTCRNCPLRSFLRRKLVLDISSWGTCGLCTMSWILFSKKLYLMTFCTSFALYKVKKTFGGSRWKLMELTHVSRYLAYVTRPHDWRIRVFCGQLKNLMEVKNKPLQQKKTCLAGKNGCCCATYIMVCAGKKCKLSMERETWGLTLS